MINSTKKGTTQMKVPQSFYEQPEIHLWFTLCEVCDEILENHENPDDLELTQCPGCGSENMTTGHDWFPV